MTRSSPCSCHGPWLQVVRVLRKDDLSALAHQATPQAMEEVEEVTRPLALDEVVSPKETGPRRLAPLPRMTPPLAPTTPALAKDC